MSPESFPKRPLYRDLRKCAKCGKNKEDGVNLLQCKACGVDFYCGKECQKADWLLHKTKCKINRETSERLAALPQGSQEVDALRRWTRLHRPSLAVLSMQELGVLQDPTVGERTLFMVMVRPRPHETNERRKFEIMQAVPFPIDGTGGIAPRIRELYQSTHASNSQLNHGTYILVIMPEGTSPPSIVPMGFELGSTLPTYHQPENIVTLINQGGLL